MYQPTVSDDRFVVRPYNCSSREGEALAQHRMTTLEYSCLAAFTFRNNTHAVVTKTSTYSTLGQYLCWFFSSDNHIQVIKAADTLLFEEEEVIKQSMLEAQFSILKDDDKGRCRNVIAIVTPPRESRVSTLPMTFTRPSPSPSPPQGVTYRVNTTGPHTQIYSPGTSGQSRADNSRESGAQTLRPALLPLSLTTALLPLSLLVGVALL